MSEMYMEQSFPFPGHPDALKLRDIVIKSLHSEKSNPSAGDWDEDALHYVRSDTGAILRGLREANIALSPKDEVALTEFADAYAERVDEEEDIAEIAQLQREGEYDD